MNPTAYYIQREREREREGGRERSHEGDRRVVRWSLGKLSVPRPPTNLDSSRARAYCACTRCGWGLFGHFSSRLALFFCFSPYGRRPDMV